MQSVLSHLVLAGMLFHSMLGCCIHHNHGDVRDALGSRAVVTDPDRHVCGEVERGSSVPPDGHRSKSCPREICVFLRHLGSEANLPVRGFPALYVCLPIGHPVASLPSVVASAVFSPPDFPAHVRLHLAKQLLLI